MKNINMDIQVKMEPEIVKIMKIMQITVFQQIIGDVEEIMAGEVWSDSRRIDKGNDDWENTIEREMVVR